MKRASHIGQCAAWLTAFSVVAAQGAERVPHIAASDSAAAGLVLTGGGARTAPNPSGADLGGAQSAVPLLDRHSLVLGRADPDHDDDYRYRLPYGDGVGYPVIQSYGARLSHRGDEFYTVDFGMPIGTPVHAAREGVVAYVEDRNDRGCWQEGCERFANFVVVLHSDGTTGAYFHLQRGSAVVSVGQTVRRGQLLARSGNTGLSTVPHLHFGVYRATREGSTASLAVRFDTRTGLVAVPRSGAYYWNAPP